MASRLTDLPMRFLMTSSLDNNKEFAIKTDPSVSKIEIKSFLASMFGFEVKKVRTLNMKGKKKERGGRLIARPDYKKVYITLKTPLSDDTFSLVQSQAIEEEYVITSV